MFAFVSLTALGTAHLGAGRSDEALPILERANRIGEASAPPRSRIARRARFALGRALWEIEGERTRAMELAKAARQDYERSQQTPTTERELASVDAWLAAHSAAP